MDTQARTQPTKAFTGPERSDATAATQGVEWTVDDVVRTIRTADGTSHHARRWLATLGALAIAAAATMTVAVAADQAAMSPKPLALPSRVASAAAAGSAASRVAALPAPAPLASRIAAAAAARTGPVARSRPLVVVMPANRDFLAATGIPVAGIALGRPHGPRIRSVTVALYVGGRLAESTDLEVYAGRFAGVLALEEPMHHAAAELRFTNPDNPNQAAVALPITLDAPATPR